VFSENVKVDRFPNRVGPFLPVLHKVPEMVPVYVVPNAIVKLACDPLSIYCHGDLLRPLMVNMLGRF
jgi:hypothetical protein